MDLRSSKNRTSRAASVALLFTALATFSCAGMRMMETGFLNRTMEIDGKTYRYVVYVPSEFDSAEKWPVVLFLHGSGERGSDGLRQTVVGLGSAIRRNPERFPMIVIFPQASEDTRWLGDEADFAIAAVDRTVEELNGDPDRVYLTGLSLGGYGSWHLALAHPDRFAALVPVCGGIVKPETAASVRQSPLTIDVEDPYELTARKLRHLPVWMFHGEEDPVIPASESRRMFDALRTVGADVQYDEVPGVGHGVWDDAYGRQGLWEWMLRQRRKQ